MFQTIIVQPIYNILVAVYGLLPGHDLGVSLIIFTLLARFAMWPLLKKQLHQSKIMRELQPELVKVKKAAAGDKQKEAALMMELYKEKGISPFGTLGLTLVQLPIFIGVFQAARELTENLSKMGTLTYSFVREIPKIQQVIENNDNFNYISFGFIDLSKKAWSNGKIYWPILILALAATVFQFLQSKQLMPQPKEKKSLRDILRNSSAGKKPEQEDMSAAMTGSMLYLMPLLTLLFAIYAQGAMVIYLLTQSLVGIFQQWLIFRKDTEEMEAEVVSVKKSPLHERVTAKTTKAVKPEPEEKVQKKGKVITKTRIITPNSMPDRPKPKKRKKR